MSSTDNAVTMKLKTLEREIGIVEKRLPFFRRWFRRFFSGRSFIAGQLIYEPWGMFKGFAAGCALAGKGVLAGFAVGWEHITDLVAGAVAVAFHSS